MRITLEERAEAGRQQVLEEVSTVWPLLFKMCDKCEAWVRREPMWRRKHWVNASTTGNGEAGGYNKKYLCKECAPTFEEAIKNF